VRWWRGFIVKAKGCLRLLGFAGNDMACYDAWPVFSGIEESAAALRCFLHKNSYLVRCLRNCFYVHLLDHEMNCVFNVIAGFCVIC